MFIILKLQERLAQVQENDKPVIVYTTCPSLEWAEKIARALVQDRQAACVNILQKMVSIFVWENDIQRADEIAMIVKTRMSLSASVIRTVKDLHPYELPAALVIPTDASPEFAAWIAECTDNGQTMQNSCDRI